ncbi:DNA-binding NarL/FixJ family response regulator [Pontibacter aydingkolensis]|uniref:Response regulator transcription factor n=1 Tax=Pontibacter aydingkolensis TaxID=1911536 RepID=A0ABS7CU50_9BACT|nr:response regulator transcription factor [Pontibacter aydingkolensis]MBW7467389.1 response regulator transcription factor [Pontibacter aydingkolensis]
MTKVLLVDDFAVVREGLKRLLSGETGIEVVAETGVGGDVLRMVEKHKIDLIILDINLPGKSGVDVLQEVKKYFPKVVVLVLSMHADKNYAVRTLKLGASAYLRKDAAPEEILRAIRRVLAGGKYITPELAEFLADFLTEGDLREGKHNLLSNREFEVMRKLAAGLTLSHLAREMSISVSTATTYKNRIYRKMGFASSTDLIRYCLAHNLVD